MTSPHDRLQPNDATLLSSFPLLLILSLPPYTLPSHLPLYFPSPHLTTTPNPSSLPPSTPARATLSPQNPQISWKLRPLNDP